ncbi:MAG: hypothetical protein QW701_02870 [Candidatus Nezhaarchaeales archaeon]
MSFEVDVGFIIEDDAEALTSTLRVNLFSAHPLVISGAWSLNATYHLLGQLADSANLVVISPYIAEGPRWLKHVSLGLNASFNPFKPVGDKLVYAHFVADAFKGAFNLNNAQTSSLRRALTRTYLTGKDPTIEDITSALELESNELTNRDAVELIEIVEAMGRGRLGAACSSHFELTNIQALISMYELPPSYASLISMAILMHLLKSGFKGVVTLCDVDILKEFIGSAWKNLIDLLNKMRAESSIVIACANGTSSIPLELRAGARMAIMGSPITPEDVRYVSAVVGRRYLRLLNSKERFAYSLAYSSGVVEVPLEETAKISAIEELKVPVEVPKSMLQAKLGNKAKMAYEVLNFLRDGASTRDSVISYAIHRLDVSSMEASKLVNALLIHGLANEVVGADGKYWLKITVRGLNALEELEALEGWLIRE